jgi:hypothetical protein
MLAPTRRLHHALDGSRMRLDADTA